MAPARLGNPSDDPQHSRAHRHPRYTDGTDTPTSAAPVQSAGPSTSRPTAATTTTSTRSTVLSVKERTERLFEYLHASCLALESLHAAGATSTLKDNTLYVERVATLLGAITPVPLQRLLLLDEARTGRRVGAPDMDASKAGERAGTKGSGLTDSLSATKRTVQLIRVDEEVVGRSTESRPTMKSSKRDVEDERGDKLGARSRTTATLVQMTAVPSDASTSSSNVSFSSAVSDNPRAATSATGVTNPISPSPAAPHLLKSPINKLLHKKSSTSFTLVKSRSMTHLAPVTAPPVRHRGTVHLLRDYSTSLSPSSCSNDASQVGFSRSEVGYTRALKGYFGKSLGGAMDSVKVEVNEGKDALEIYTGNAEPSVRDKSNHSKTNLPTDSDEWSKALHLGSRQLQQSTRREPVFFRRAEGVNLVCCIRIRARNFQTAEGHQYDANSDPHLRFAQRQIQQLHFIHDAHVSVSDTKTFAYRTIRFDNGSDDAGSTEESESRTEWLVFSTAATSTILQTPNARFRWPMVYRWSTVEKSCEWVISFNLLRDGG